MMTFLLLQDTTAIHILGNQDISLPTQFPLQPQGPYSIIAQTSSRIKAHFVVVYSIMTLSL